jgi:hypothetical protein
MAKTIACWHCVRTRRKNSADLDAGAIFCNGLKPQRPIVRAGAAGVDWRGVEKKARSAHCGIYISLKDTKAGFIVSLRLAGTE